MGCRCSRDGRKIIVSSKMKEKNKFILNIHIPKTDNKKILFYISNNEKETLSNIFNELFLNKYPELDANIISVYNPTTDSYDYYIQSLLGYKIENVQNPKLGQMWNIYLNNEKLDWNSYFDNFRSITYKDEIDLKYEDYTSKDSYQSKEFNSSDSNNFIE